MELSVTQAQARVPVTILHVNGSIDSSTYQQFQDKAMELVNGGAGNLLIDLEHVSYMSSAGLRALNHLYNALRDQSESAAAVSKGVTAGTYKSPHLKLLAPRARVRDTLKMSGMDMFLDIYPDSKSALAAF